MIEKVRASKPVEIIKSILANKYFAFATAFVTVLFYYLGLELVTIYFLVISGALMLLFLDDLTPLAGVALFALILMSPKHTPSNYFNEPSNFLFSPAFKVQLVFFVIIFGGAAIFRFADTIISKKFTITPIFVSLSVFCFLLLFNGAAAQGYTPRNILYALALSGCFLGVYSLIKDNIVWSGETVERLSLIFFAFAISLLFEEIMVYATTENLLLANGAINRTIFKMGWGMYNNLSCLMLLCLPFPLYLAANKKFGFLYLIFSLIFAIGIIFTLSRQGMVTVVLVYPACLVALLLKGKNRRSNLITVAAAAVLGAIILGVFHNEIFTLLSSNSDTNKFAMIFVGLAAVAIAGLSALFLLCKNKKINLAVYGGLIALFLIALIIKRDDISQLVDAFMEASSSRNLLWEQAFEAFEAFPAFGVGFYRELTYDPGFSGLNFIPDMYHNTIVQLLGACGFFGLAAYLAHRIVTIYSLSKRPTFERLTIAASIAGLLISCMFDNHIFYLTGTVVYGILLAFLDKSYYAETGALPLNKTFNRA